MYKVGDKITIKSLDRILKSFEYNGDEYCDYYENKKDINGKMHFVVFATDMKEYCGKRLTIIDTRRDGNTMEQSYYCHEDGSVWAWTEDMFENEVVAVKQILGERVREMLMKNTMISICLMVMLMTGCADMNKAQKGAVGGAAGGAMVGQMIGKNTEATLIGAGVGMMLGYIVGNEMDKWDKQNLNTAYEMVPSGQTMGWQNPDSGNQYAVTPQPSYSTASNQYCRKAEIQAIIDGKQESTYSTACRNNQGQWELQ